MAGLDNIISRIYAESDAAAAKTRSAARAQAEEIVNVAREEAERQCADIETRGEHAAADILARGRSTADRKRRQRLLAEKQRLINETIAMAGETLRTLDTADYFERMRKLAVRTAHPGRGVLIFSKRDLDRVPADFGKKLNAALRSRGAVLRISKETRTMDGGFVLVYGCVEENCSIDALFDSARERLQDKARDILF